LDSDLVPFYLAHFAQPDQGSFKKLFFLKKKDEEDSEPKRVTGELSGSLTDPSPKEPKAVQVVLSPSQDRSALAPRSVVLSGNTVSPSPSQERVPSPEQPRTERIKKPGLKDRRPSAVELQQSDVASSKSSGEKRKRSKERRKKGIEADQDKGEEKTRKKTTTTGDEEPIPKEEGGDKKEKK
jgi:hypothetical protein